MEYNKAALDGSAARGWRGPGRRVLHERLGVDPRGAAVVRAPGERRLATAGGRVILAPPRVFLYGGYYVVSYLLGLYVL